LTTEGFEEEKDKVGEQQDSGHLTSHGENRVADRYMHCRKELHIKDSGDKGFGCSFSNEALSLEDRFKIKYLLSFRLYLVIFFSYTFYPI
jgi:hypothetical protein